MAFGSLLSAVSVISSLTALSRIFGFIRDIVFAFMMGAGPAADAFLIAFKLPNLFRRLTAEGALTHAFLPAYSMAKEQKNTAQALILATEVQAWLFLALSIIVVVMELTMGGVISMLAPGYAEYDSRADAAIFLARITMPYLVMISLIGLWSAISHAEDDYIGSGATPIILNICLILAALLIPTSEEFFHYDSAYIAFPLALAVPIAGVLQMLVMQQRLRRLGRRPHWQFRRLSAGGRAMWRSFVPAALGAGGMQLNLIIDLVLASWLAVGSLSWLYYADRLAQLPLGVIGIAIGTALLPRLSAVEAQSIQLSAKQEQFTAYVTQGLNIAVIAVFPATLGLVFLADELIAGLFVFGAFTAQDGTAAAAALKAYAIGLPAFACIKISQAALYALNKPGIVFRISLLSVCINLIFSLFLMRIYAHIGLALATSISLWVAVILQFGFLTYFRRMGWKWVATASQAGLAAAIMAGMLYLAENSQIINDLNDRIAMLVLVVLGIILYIAVAVALGLHHHLRKTQHGKS